MSKLLSLREAIASDILWFESHSASESEYGRISRIEDDGCYMTIDRLGEHKKYEDARLYGISWRCWDKKPTADTRKAAAGLDHDHGCWDCLHFD